MKKANSSNFLTKMSLIGDESEYQKPRRYTPDWKNGDLFFHTLTHPNAEPLGIVGWTILFYKVGEYIDEAQHLLHLMYVSVCPPGEEPTTAAQLQSLGFLRVMQHDDKWDYLTQITVTSKKNELSYGLSKAGNFIGILPPADCTRENPLTAFPLFGTSRQGNGRPDYEDQICRLFKKYGKLTK